MTDLEDIVGLDLSQIDPYDFEKLVAKIWEEHGWETTVTSSSQDRGIDVIAKQELPIELKLLIQAKAYSVSNTIGSDEVRKYRTLYEQDPEADAVAIVTTGQFTSQAESLADDLSIRLVDGVEVMNLIKCVDLVSFIRIVSPVDTGEYDLKGVPAKSKTKTNCPKCGGSGTIWEADTRDRGQILVCGDCDTTWESNPAGGWSTIR